MLESATSGIATIGLFLAFLAWGGLSVLVGPYYRDEKRRYTPQQIRTARVAWRRGDFDSTDSTDSRVRSKLHDRAVFEVRRGVVSLVCETAFILAIEMLLVGGYRAPGTFPLIVTIQVVIATRWSWVLVVGAPRTRRIAKLWIASESSSVDAITSTESPTAVRG